MNVSTRGRASNRPGVRRTGGRPVRGGGPDQRWRRILPLVLLGVVTVAVVLLYFTPLFGVRSVEVRGARTLDEREVISTAAVEMGTPMLQVDSEEIDSRLRTLPPLSSVEVVLAWPSTVRLEVSERLPVAFMTAVDGIHLVDAAGIPFKKAAEPPAGVPELLVRRAAPDDPATHAGLTALMALEPAVRDEVRSIAVNRSTDVRMQLTGGREVHWGTLDELERKAAILPLLLTQPGRVYDVTSPELPTIAKSS